MYLNKSTKFFINLNSVFIMCQSLITDVVMIVLFVILIELRLCDCERSKEERGEMGAIGNRNSGINRYVTITIRKYLLLVYNFLQCTVFM